MHQQERGTLITTQLFVSYVLQSMGVQTTACIQAECKQLISHAQSSHWIASLGEAFRAIRAGVSISAVTPSLLPVLLILWLHSFISLTFSQLLYDPLRLLKAL